MARGRPTDRVGPRRDDGQDGTRLAVEHILDELAAGTPVEQLLEAHPRLTREAVSAALAFAARALRADVVYPLARRPA